jgi:hypothetical protein
MPDIDELSSLQHQLENKKETLLLIQERKSEYALSTDIPLDLIRQERDVREEIAALEAQIKALEQSTRSRAVPPVTAPSIPAPPVRKSASGGGRVVGVIILVTIVVVAALFVLQLLNRVENPSAATSKPTTVQTAVLPASTSQVESTRPQSTTAAATQASQALKTAGASATPAAAFAPAKPTPTLTPPTAVNLTNNREGKYEYPSLLFDQAGTLHLVFASPLLRSSGDYFHQQLPAGGGWTQAESLTNGFVGMWSNLELRQNAQGQLCVLWSGIDKVQDEGYYMRCQTGPDWLQRQVTKWRPKTFDTRAGFSAVIRPDGNVDAAFVRVGNDAISFNDTPDIMQDHLAATGYDVDLERDAAGNYHIMWFRAGKPYSLQYRRSSDGGRTWTATERLTTEANAPGNEGALIADTRGAVHLVWRGDSEGIYYRRWMPEAGWSEVTELSQGVNGRSPQVAVDSQGLVRVVWDASPGIWHAAQAPDGSWPAPRLIASGGNGFDYYSGPSCSRC